MKFDVGERIVLLNLLPAQGNILTLRVVEELKKKLAFSEEDIKEFGLETKDTQVRWNPKTAKVKEVQIGDTGKTIIVNALKKLDEDKKLETYHMGLYERFVEGKE